MFGIGPRNKKLPTRSVNVAPESLGSAVVNPSLVWVVQSQWTPEETFFFLNRASIIMSNINVGPSYVRAKTATHMSVFLRAGRWVLRYTDQDKNVHGLAWAEIQTTRTSFQRGLVVIGIDSSACNMTSISIKTSLEILLGYAISQLEMDELLLIPKDFPKDMFDTLTEWGQTKKIFSPHILASQPIESSKCWEQIKVVQIDAKSWLEQSAHQSVKHHLNFLETQEKRRAKLQSLQNELNKKGRR